MARDWTSAAFIGGEKGFVAVRKHVKIKGSEIVWSVWHLPGGKREPDDANEPATLIHEVRDETGIDITGCTLKKVFWEKRCYQRKIRRRKRRVRYQSHSYTYTLYRVLVTETMLQDFVSREHDHEARVISYKEYRVMTDFSPTDRKIIETHHLCPQTNCTIGCV